MRLIDGRVLVFLTCVVLSTGRCGRACGDDDIPTAEELLQRIRDRDAKYETRVSSTAWTDSSNSWNVTTIHRHADGRIRVHYRNGTYDAEGRRILDERAESEELYNGTITVHRAWYPDSDEEGAPLDETARGAPHAGYHSAMVWDGLFSNPRAMRNPWGVGQSGLTYALEEIVEDGRELAVERVDPKKNLFRVIYQRRADGDTPGPTYTAEIDGDRDWIVPRIAGHDADGRLVSEDVTEFTQDEQERWIPVRGSVRRGPMPSGWSLEWRFETLRFEVDAEEINDQAFAVIIEPNTSIYDIRHQVGYRSPRFRRLVNPELELYALEALLERIETSP